MMSRAGWARLMVLWCVAQVAVAAEQEAENITFDRSAAALKRGAQIVTGVCMGCHSLHYLRYRDLLSVGFTLPELTTLRGTQSIDDPLLSALTDDAAVASFGLVPPDQSLLAKAREGGARHIYSVVTGYAKDAQGTLINNAFPGIRMPDILDYAAADAAQRVTLQQQAQDAAVFLEWAADPRAEQRYRLGKYVLAYLAVLTLLLYLLKRRIWARLPPPQH